MKVLEAPMVRLDNVVRSFPASGRMTVTALDRVSLSIRRGESLGVVGEAGSGKSTLARCVAGLLTPTSGQVSFHGMAHPLATTATVRGAVGDPYGGLNPRRSVGSIICDPFTQGSSPGRNRGREVRELIRLVGLDPFDELRYPNELSPGDRQRVCIARALALHPRLLVWDEPIAALDVCEQAQLLTLVRRLRRELALTYLFVSRSHTTAGQVSDRIAVLDHGRIVEVGS